MLGQMKQNIFSSVAFWPCHPLRLFICAYVKMDFSTDDYPDGETHLD